MPVKFAPYISGNLQEYVSSNYPDEFSERKWGPKQDDGTYLVTTIEGEWREIQPFTSTMYYDGWYKGRSAVRIWWKDDDGHRWPMFMSDFDVLLQEGKIGSWNRNGEETGSMVTGSWTIVKRGANYGVAPVNE